MKTNNPRATIRPKQIKRERLEVTYPIVGGLENRRIQDYINGVIFNIVEETIRKQGYYDNPETEITGIYYIRTNAECLLSISIEIYAFSGGAHGFTILESVTFDLRTGTRYQLRSFFQDRVDYVRFISDVVRRQIVEKDIPVIEEFTAIKPNQDFYIENRNLVVYFQLYELAPYSSGFPTFEIPLSELCGTIGSIITCDYCATYKHEDYYKPHDHHDHQYSHYKPHPPYDHGHDHHYPPCGPGQHPHSPCPPHHGHEPPRPPRPPHHGHEPPRPPRPPGPPRPPHDGHHQHPDYH